MSRRPHERPRDAAIRPAVVGDANPDVVLALAAACGALSTRAHGGTPAQPTWDEALAATSRTDENHGKSPS
jgi:sugar/nucleoside kinase (ribokinase family)